MGRAVARTLLTDASDVFMIRLCASYKFNKVFIAGSLRCFYKTDIHSNIGTTNGFTNLMRNKSGRFLAIGY